MPAKETTEPVALHNIERINNKIEKLEGEEAYEKNNADIDKLRLMLLRRERMMKEREAHDKALELLNKKRRRQMSQVYRQSDNVLIPAVKAKDKARAESECQSHRPPPRTTDTYGKILKVHGVMEETLPQI